MTLGEVKAAALFNLRPFRRPAEAVALHHTAGGDH
jgi:hypothetical protein